jgi:threonine/homoserine/homoserine lactone efflux protein
MFALLIFAFFTGLSGALMPGPLLAVTISETARTGFWAGPLVVAGHGALELALIVALVMGLSRILSRPVAFGVLGIVGGAVLAWMAWGMLHVSPAEANLAGHLATRGAGTAVSTFWRPIGLGVWTSLANVYWIVWWGTFGMTLISRALKHGKAGLGVFWLGHVSSDFVWYTAVAAAVALGRNHLMTPAIYRVVLGICGVALLGLAAYFAFSGIRALVRRAEPPLPSKEPAA